MSRSSKSTTDSTSSTRSNSPVRLKPCPDNPNCVSSLSQPEDTEHFVQPLEIRNIERPISALVEIVGSLKRTTLVSRTDDYLHFEFRSLIFRFTDDVEFLVDSTDRLIHVRSASRIGYSDLGANRKRVENIREKWDELANS